MDAQDCELRRKECSYNIPHSITSKLKANVQGYDELDPFLEETATSCIQKSFAFIQCISSQSITRNALCCMPQIVIALLDRQPRPLSRLLVISVSWLHAQTLASTECHPRELHPRSACSQNECSICVPTWTLDVPNDATGCVVHKLHAHLCHTTTRTYSSSDLYPHLSTHLTSLCTSHTSTAEDPGDLHEFDWNPWCGLAYEPYHRTCMLAYFAESIFVIAWKLRDQLDRWSRVSQGYVCAWTPRGRFLF